jgi:hypothetical protein
MQTMDLFKRNHCSNRAEDLLFVLIEKTLAVDLIKLKIFFKNCCLKR